MITLDRLVSDLELRLSESKPSQDLQVTQGQIAEWIDEARDFVTRVRIDENKGSIDPSILMTIRDQSSVYDPVRKRITIPIGSDVLDLKSNNGISAVFTDGGIEFSQVNPAEQISIKKMAFTKPSSCNYIYFREGSDLILDGPNPNTVSSLYITRIIVPAETHRVKEFNEKYYIMPSTVQDILTLAEEIGLRELRAGIMDLSNDGTSNDTQ